jgi:hypothetical protein
MMWKLFAANYCIVWQITLVNQLSVAINHGLGSWAA